MNNILAAVIAGVLGFPSVCAAQPLLGDAAPTRGPLVTSATYEASRLRLASMAHSPQAGEIDIWAKTGTRPTGTTVRITLRDGAVIEGELVTANPDSITLVNNELKSGRLGRTSQRWTR